jgi:ferredoxin
MQQQTNILQDQHIFVIVMSKYNIEVDRERCISTGSCYSLDPVHFESDENQKSTVKGGKTNDTKSTGKFEDEKLSSAQEAEKACPVDAIKVTKNE